jgi:hypothetical protein
MDDLRERGIDEEMERKRSSREECSCVIKKVQILRKYSHGIFLRPFYVFNLISLII